MNVHEDSWLEVKAHIDKELLLCSSKLENNLLDFSSTQYLRGKIFSLKSILALPDKKERKDINYQSTEEY